MTISSGWFQGEI